MEETTEMHRKDVEFSGKIDIVLRPELENSISRAASRDITNEYIRTCYKDVKKEVMQSHKTVSE